MIFSPQIRDRVIDSTIANMIMAGYLRPCKVAQYMAELTAKSDDELASRLCASKIVYDDYLEQCWSLN